MKNLCVGLSLLWLVFSSANAGAVSAQPPAPYRPVPLHHKLGFCVFAIAMTAAPVVTGAVFGTPWEFVASESAIIALGSALTRFDGLRAAKVD